MAANIVCILCHVCVRLYTERSAHLYTYCIEMRRMYSTIVSKSFIKYRYLCIYYTTWLCLRDTTCRHSKRSVYIRYTRFVMQRILCNTLQRVPFALYANRTCCIKHIYIRYNYYIFTVNTHWSYDGLSAVAAL